MGNNVQISLIVPVYNSENFVEKAIKSVLDQKFKNFELILVNDGSTDKSGEICQQYAEMDKRIKYISKENGGLCSARNAGIDQAVGNYIMFMDNDDELDSNAFMLIDKIIRKFHTDVIRFNRKRIQIYDDNSTKADIYGCKGICDDGKTHYFKRETFFKNYAVMRQSGCFAGIWNGAYKRELFENIRFDTEIVAGGEDGLVNIKIYEIFQSIVFIPDVLYIYFRRTSHSVSTAYNDNHIIANIKCASAERRLIKNNGLSDEMYFKSAILYIALSVKLLCHKDARLTFAKKKEILTEMRSEECYQFDKNALKYSKASLLVKAYLLLFLNGNDHLLLNTSNIIFKLRGNT